MQPTWSLTQVFGCIGKTIKVLRQDKNGGFVSQRYQGPFRAVLALLHKSLCTPQVPLLRRQQPCRPDDLCLQAE